MGDCSLYTRPSDIFYILDALIYTLLSYKIFNASSSYCYTFNRDGFVC